MVASHHPSSQSAGRRPAKPCPRRSIPSVDAEEGRRPRLRLVVNNTSHESSLSSGLVGEWHRSAAGGDPADDQAGEHASVSVELRAWAAAAARLAEARLRLARQRLINHFGHLGLAGRIAGLAPVIALGSLAVFGGLFALRFAQESASPEPPATVAAVTVAVPATIDDTGSPAADQSVNSESEVVVVHPGDSLWSIATSRFPRHDPRRVVDAFVEVNGGSAITSGQQLIVPAALTEG